MGNFFRVVVAVLVSAITALFFVSWWNSWADKAGEEEIKQLKLDFDASKIDWDAEIDWDALDIFGVFDK